MAVPRAKLFFWLKLAKARIPVVRRIRLLNRTAEVDNYFGRPIQDSQQANESLLRSVRANEVFAAGKIGFTELEALFKYTATRGSSATRFESLQRGHELEFLYVNSGVFPKDPETIRLWVEVYLAALSHVDYLGVWFNRGEDVIVRDHARRATLVRDTGLEPYYHSNPWTAGLEGKRVLVVTPFADSIQKQYDEKGGGKLFPGNPSVLPAFELLVVRAPLSPALVAPQHPTWHDALTDLKERMATAVWDVCIIGAGAYSIPLCAYARAELQRTAIHLGGGTQLMFGVRGRRWDGHPVIEPLFNEHWIRPLAHETPRQKWRNEGGAYW